MSHRLLTPNRSDRFLRRSSSSGSAGSSIGVLRFLPRAPLVCETLSAFPVTGSVFNWSEIPKRAARAASLSGSYDVLLGESFKFVPGCAYFTDRGFRRNFLRRDFALARARALVSGFGRRRGFGLNHRNTKARGTLAAFLGLFVGGGLSSFRRG
jgi:hypothetical protein